jgi:hypothetical protein
MKIISFPHYTCGGLLCDIMNQTYSPVGGNGEIQSLRHSFGKIGDSDSVYTNFDPQRFEKLVNKYQDYEHWIGTHCWLGKTDLGKIHQVINITTLTHKSKLYRWIRAYHHYYLKSQPWQGLDGLDAIDKQRETAKTYLTPFDKIDNPRVINLEFCSVVECSQDFINLVPRNYKQHLDRWQQINSFLYDAGVWTSVAADRFHEAEYELALETQYVYH